MKNLILLCAIVCITMVSVDSTAQKFAKVDKSEMDAAYFPSKSSHRLFEKDAEKKKSLEPKIRVLYSRPKAKGREIFGSLVKYNEPWRTGANEAPEILFYTDVEIGGKKVKAGRYTMFVTPSEKEWELTLNSDLDLWGVYVLDRSHDITSVKAKVQKSNNKIEDFSIALYEKSKGMVHLKMGWDKTICEFPIKLL